MKRIKRAFTLIELLVVVAIIGILAAIVIINVSNARAKATRTKVETDMATVNKIVAACRSFDGGITDMFSPITGSQNIVAINNPSYAGTTAVCGIIRSTDASEIAAQSGNYPKLPNGYFYISGIMDNPAAVMHTAGNTLTCDGRVCTKAGFWDTTN